MNISHLYSRRHQARTFDRNNESRHVLATSLLGRECDMSGGTPVHMPKPLPAYDRASWAILGHNTPIPEGFTAKRVKGRGRGRQVAIVRSLLVTHCPKRVAKGVQQDRDNGKAVAHAGALPHDMAASPHGWQVGVREASLVAIGAGEAL